MKFFAILSASIFAASAAADSCNRGGNYRDHIVETLQAAGQPTDESRIQNSKFDCIGGGDIVYREFCSRGCGGTDSEDPDYCF
ncbi:hypothetical protein Micbo1qcDRAFT_209001 [Microdochium bolleyi]|uniref:Uncharacterized protein n=1 Tax=Microdochium bolleyi TaxID=196109 RepID=A0A136IPE9_9PEZI|nr:hypothetical protein Micbo1qcDRAFT_209001 [Microdochium bolleyi]